MHKMYGWYEEEKQAAWKRDWEESGVKRIEQLNLSIEIELSGETVLCEGNLSGIIKKIRDELKAAEENPQVKIIFKWGR